MHVKVAVIGGAADGLEVTLTQFPVTLGREGDCVVPIHDRWASRHHCQLFQREDELYVRDLASKHGTIVNSSPVDECQLHEGNRLLVGLTALLIQEINHDEATTPGNVLADQGSGVST